jgi:hypothetical protein
MEEALLARLLAATSVAALVGDRGAWDERPGGDLFPSLMLSLVTPGRAYTHDGAHGLQSPLVQIDCFATTPDAAKALATAVVLVLEPATTIGGIIFQRSFLEGARSFEPEDLPGGIRVFRRILEMRLWWAAA